MPLASAAQVTFHTRVTLDEETFRDPKQRVELQGVADRVAEEIDNLIPGRGFNVGDTPIICFEAPDLWKGNPARPAPITLTGMKLEGEPASTSAGSIRIALSEVLPADHWKFAYQLSHELTHVKMGANVSNYMIETFAMAASDEVLRRMGLFGYLLRNEGADIQQLPESVQRDLALKQWRTVQIFWQSRIAAQGTSMNDRPFQTLGVYLLRHSHHMRWNLLLEISRLSLSMPNTDKTFTICPPDISAMSQRGLPMDALGFLP